LTISFHKEEDLMTINHSIIYLAGISLVNLFFLTVPAVAQTSNQLQVEATFQGNPTGPSADLSVTKQRRRRQRSIPSPSNTNTSTNTSNLATEMLNVHNKYRSELGIPSVTWSNTLASHAQQWANHLANSQQFEHSQGTGEGENLWMGTAGYFSYSQMAAGWASEKQHFRYGTFPDVSTTGRWFDVGHYTQMIWQNTTEIGCAVATGGGNDILVCRYNPPGNYQGQRPY
jgi:Cysteine-rich secretory protein family